MNLTRTSIVFICHNNLHSVITHLSSSFLVSGDGLLYEIPDQYLSASTGHDNPSWTKTDCDFHCGTVASPTIPARWSVRQRWWCNVLQPNNRPLEVNDNGRSAGTGTRGRDNVSAAGVPFLFFLALRPNVCVAQLSSISIASWRPYGRSPRECNSYSAVSRAGTGHEE